MQRPRPIEVSSRVIIDIRDQAIRIKESKVSPRVPVRQLDLKRHAVVKDSVHSRRVLLHLPALLRGVRWLVRPVVARHQAACGGETVQRREVQGCDVHEYEVPGSGLVDPIKGLENAVDIITNSLAVQRAVCEQRVVPQVVSADPHAVDGVISLAVRKKRVRFRGLVDVRCVCLIGGHLVAEYVGEGAADGIEVAVDHIVAANGS